MNSYKHDIAISLCKQDVEFARKLVNALNPGLKIFFYEDRQEELINKSGPEAFAKCFKEEARVVVILSRNEWSESYYTDIERNAIIDRTSVKNQGYNFLMVIPMEPDQAPHWYPSTRIYADPRKFSIEQLAMFIEFKITEEGGVVKVLTSEEYSAYFISQLKEKNEIVRLQNSAEAIEYLRSEVKKFKSLFTSKTEYFSGNKYQFPISQRPFSDFVDNSLFGIGSFRLYVEIQNMGNRYPLVTTQQADLWIKLSKGNSQMQHSDIKTEQYKFYYSEKLRGWAIPVTYSGNNPIHISHLFTEYSQKWYDLKNHVATEVLLDNWFTELWKRVEQDFKQIL